DLQTRNHDNWTLMVRRSQTPDGVLLHVRSRLNVVADVGDHFEVGTDEQHLGAAATKTLPRGMLEITREQLTAESRHHRPRTPRAAGTYGATQHDRTVRGHRRFGASGLGVHTIRWQLCGRLV